MARMGRTIIRRLEWSNEVLSALRQYRDSLAESLADAGFGDVDHWTKTFRLLADELESSMERLEETELALADERGETREIREERDRVKSELRDELIEIQSLLRGLGGNTLVERFGLSGETPQAHADLENKAKSVLHSLQEAGDTIEGHAGAAVDTAALVDELEPLYERFTEARQAMQADEHAREDVMLERDEARDALERTYRGTAGMVEHAFRIADMPELADRLRPTRRRTRGETSPAEEGEPEGRIADAPRNPEEVDSLTTDRTGDQGDNPRESSASSDETTTEAE